MIAKKDQIESIGEKQKKKKEGCFHKKQLPIGLYNWVWVRGR